MNLKYGLCVLFSLSTYFVFGQNINVRASCDPLEWRCKNGECITSDELCDGRKDCKDGSDETTEACLNYRCPSYAFRCAYGACVDRKASCNKIQECADNSDESPFACGSSAKPIPLSSKCSQDEFQCTSGHCISNEKLCDGKADCRDQSDETVNQCSAIYCPTYAFRCGYGACINGDAKCNGKSDCVDNSDEMLSICGPDHTTQATVQKVSKRPIGVPSRTTVTMRTTTSTSTPRTQIPTSQVSQTGECYVEPIMNLKYVYESSPEEEIEPGSFVGNYIGVMHKCAKKYNLIGPTTNTCINGKWASAERLTCLKFCDSNSIKGISFQAACEYKGAGVSCNEEIRPNTTAIISCRVGYQKQENDPGRILFCRDDGEWDYTPKSCEPICGKNSTNVTPFIAGGVITNPKKVPWHAAIYQIVANGNIEHICGGSILNAKVIVTAAHCVWHESFSKKVDHTTLRVAVGKFYRSYGADEALPAQYFNISEIHVERGYSGSQSSFQHDIALLILNNFIIYTTYIAPICIEWKNYAEQTVNSGEIGVTPGWGLDDTGEYNNELRTVKLKTYNYKECRNGFDPTRLGLISPEKFCVGIKNGRGICIGDSGGSFAVYKNDRYYLWGVVSIGFVISTQETVCTTSNISLYTNIQFFSQFINTYEPQYRPR